MKINLFKILQRLALLNVIVLAGIVLAGLELTGCKTSPPVVAYKTEGVIITTVDSAMTAWADYVKQGNATQKQVDTVKAAYQKYYAAQQVAKVALTEYVAAQTDATRASWESAMKAATATQGFLIDLVKSLLQ